jgi:hypothetical protein
MIISSFSCYVNHLPDFRCWFGEKYMMAKKREKKNDDGNCKSNEEFRTLDRKDFRDFQSIERRN